MKRRRHTPEEIIRSVWLTAAMPRSSNGHRVAARAVRIAHQ
jgi:hypothetical protein